MNDGMRQATVIEPVMVPASAAHAMPSMAAGTTLQPHRAHRQVDAADDQDKGHADREHHQVRDLVGQGAEGVVGQKVIAEYREQRDHRQQGARQAQIGAKPVEVAARFTG
jgi:hypothetical protein